VHIILIFRLLPTPGPSSLAQRHSLALRQSGHLLARPTAFLPYPPARDNSLLASFFSISLCSFCSHDPLLPNHLLPGQPFWQNRAVLAGYVPNFGITFRGLRAPPTDCIHVYALFKLETFLEPLSFPVALGLGFLQYRQNHPVHWAGACRKVASSIPPSFLLATGWLVCFFPFCLFPLGGSPALCCPCATLRLGI
jgi:hypothetical protein